MKSRRVNALIVVLVLATSIFCNCVSALDCETRTESYDSAYGLLNTDTSVSPHTSVAIGAYKTVSCGSMYVSSYVTLSIKSNSNGAAISAVLSNQSTGTVASSKIINGTGSCTLYVPSAGNYKLYLTNNGSSLTNVAYTYSVN